MEPTIGIESVSSPNRIYWESPVVQNITCISGHMSLKLWKLIQKVTEKLKERPVNIAEPTELDTIEIYDVLRQRFCQERS